MDKLTMNSWCVVSHSGCSITVRYPQTQNNPLKKAKIQQGGRRARLELWNYTNTTWQWLWAHVHFSVILSCFHCGLLLSSSHHWLLGAAESKHAIWDEDIGGKLSPYDEAMFQQLLWGDAAHLGRLTIFSYLPVSASHRNRRTQKAQKGRDSEYHWHACAKIQCNGITTDYTPCLSNYPNEEGVIFQLNILP